MILGKKYVPSRESGKALCELSHTWWTCTCRNKLEWHCRWNEIFWHREGLLVKKIEPRIRLPLVVYSVCYLLMPGDCRWHLRTRGGGKGQNLAHVENRAQDTLLAFVVHALEEGEKAEKGKGLRANAAELGVSLCPGCFHVVHHL